MKKVILTIMSMVLSVAFALNVCAAEMEHPTNSLEEYSVSINMEDLDINDKVTFEEAVSLKASHENISYEEARKKLLVEEDRILTELAQAQKLRLRSNKSIEQLKAELNAQNVIEYYSYEKTFSYPKRTSFKAQLQASIVLVDDYSNHKFIDRVDWIYTRRVAGEYTYDWIESAVSSNIAAGKKSVRLAADGYFTSSKDVSGGGSFSLPGFSVDSSVGTTVTLMSETVHVAYDYTVY
ncbi:MAG: hypothetical protein ACLUFH_00715 [Monoglobales bacterium]